MYQLDVEPLPAAIADFTRAEMQRLTVPGVAVGVTLGDAAYAEGFGVTNVEFPLPVTAHTQFQIGSTSKTFTATVAMMLAEDGVLDLDARVREYLPDFRTDSEHESGRVTLRHLLTHHAGWPGDYFKDFGRGDDALAVYVRNMVRAKQQLPAGAAFSYCNSAFYLLARIIEVVSDRPFETVVQQRLIDPLAMAMTTYFPEDTITNGVASGHILTAEGARVARPWHMARCLNGGGGIIADVLDQLCYARFHLRGGMSHSGERLLAEKAVRRMQEPHAEAGSMCDRYGLGWMLIDHAGEPLVKHGGATHGFLSSFEMYPNQQFACTVLTNADSGRELRDTVAAFARRHFLHLDDLAWRPMSRPPDLGEFAGKYRAALATCVVAVAGSRLQITPRANPRPNRGIDPLPDTAAELTFYAADRTVVMGGTHRGERCEFVRGADGTIEWLRWDGRLARRVR